MKTNYYILIMVIAKLISLTTHAEMIMDVDDFEHDTIGSQPFKATAISPTATTGSTFIAVADQTTTSTTAGTGNGVRLFDNSTGTDLQLEYDFTIISDIPPASDLDDAARLSAVRVDLAFAPLSTTGTNNDYLSITLGEHLIAQSDSSKHFIICRLFDNGTISFLSTTGPESTGHILNAADNTLSIFANDYDSQSIQYVGPDDNTHELPSNSVAYWLNGSRITFGGQGYTDMENRNTSNGTVFTSSNNLGRFAIVSSANSNGLDYIFDDIMIFDLDFVQSPTNTSWLVSNTLAGLEYTGYANEGQTNAVNTVPDYSGAGYQGGGVPIPFVPAVITVSPSGADDGAHIQSAIDTVSNLPVGANGFRGAVKLEAGEYTVANTLNVHTSGVVIRGAGSQENGGTRITYTSTTKSNLFNASNNAGSPSETNGTRQPITDPYVPVGAKSFSVSNASIYSPGDKIIIQMMVNQQWIDDIDMAQWGWTTGYYQAMRYRRVVTAVNGNEITIDGPVLQTIENQYGGAEVYKYTYSGLENVGFESMRLESAYASETDEDHGWNAIYIANLENGWVRQVTSRYFGFGLVNITNYSRQITVEDCAHLDPKSTTAGGRRYSFTVDEADNILWQRCLTRGGRHDFASGSRVQGPNVYVDCRASETYNDIGPHHRYSTGQLYDNIFGGEMNVQNRASSGSGHGWSGAQVMFWNCDASSIVCDAPTGAMNWVVGSSTYKADSRRTPDEPFGIWDSLNQAVTPRSLYYAQLADRLGTNVLNNIILPEQKAGNIWAELLLWDGDGLFMDDVMTWADTETVAKPGVPHTIGGVVRNLQMLDRGNLTYTWSPVSGPGAVTFNNNTGLETTATFSQKGSYVLNLLVDDGTVQASANLMIDVLDSTSSPAAPVNLVATAGDGSVSLDWNDNVEPDLERYILYRSETPSGSNGFTTIDTNITLSDYIDNTVVNGTTYYYWVTAVDSDNDESERSNEISTRPQADITPPAAPTGLVALAFNGRVSLSWNDNGESDFTSYRVYRSTHPVNHSDTLVTDLKSSNYEDVTAENGTTYYYIVTAIDWKGNESVRSAGVSATPQEPSSSDTFLFGTDNAGLAGFTTSTPDAAQETWSVEAGSVRYINDDPDGGPDIGTSGSTKNSSLLRAFTLDRSVGKNYTIEGIVNLTDGYADDNNRIGIYLFGDVANLTGAGGPEEDEVGALSLIYNTDSGNLSLYNGIDRSQITGVSTGRTEDDSIFGSNHTVTFTAEISFLELDGIHQIQIEGTFKDEFGATTHLTSTVVAADYTGDYFGFATRARNRGTASSDRNAPFTMDYQSFRVTDNSAPTDLLPAAPSGLVATPGNGQINLDWDNNTEGNLASYNVYRRTASETYATTPLQADLTNSEFIDSTAANGATYYYMVTAVDSNGDESASSIEVSTNLSNDLDGDFMADDWEIAYFGSASAKDGSADSDNDGVLDFFEYLYGSDPTLPDQNSFQFGVNLEQNGTNLILSWEVLEGFILGQDYEVEVSTDLSLWDLLPAEHFSLTENTVGGKTEVELTLTNDYGSKVFLRLAQPVDS